MYVYRYVYIYIYIYIITRRAPAPRSAGLLRAARAVGDLLFIPGCLIRPRLYASEPRLDLHIHSPQVS